MDRPGSRKRRGTGAPAAGATPAGAAPATSVAPDAVAPATRAPTVAPHMLELLLPVHGGHRRLMAAPSQLICLQAAQNDQILPFWCCCAAG
uniref:Uncharacterized protein n=1 Tax=Arundo donax TaxID=35708 RepID=A0A0A9HTN5_ARUDO